MQSIQYKQCKNHKTCNNFQIFAISSCMIKLFVSEFLFCSESHGSLHRWPHGEPRSRTSYCIISFSFFIICSLALIPSLQSFMLFSCTSLFFSRSPFPFLTVAVNCLSHALQAWLYPDPRGNYWENISGYHRLCGYAPYQFLQLARLKSWMKNDNTLTLT